MLSTLMLVLKDKKRVTNAAKTVGRLLRAGAVLFTLFGDHDGVICNIAQPQ
jgi:hypothetical protein